LSVWRLGFGSPGNLIAGVEAMNFKDEHCRSSGLTWIDAGGTASTVVCSVQISYRPGKRR
jgi:hypothetical protein